jgi:hypothetical protein
MLTNLHQTILEQRKVSMSRDLEQRANILLESLRLAVPLWVLEFQADPALKDRVLSDMRTYSARAGQGKPVGENEYQTSIAEMIAAHGDDLVFGGKHCAATFNSLAKGIALTALVADGGICFMDLRWEVVSGKLRVYGDKPNVLRKFEGLGAKL